MLETLSLLLLSFVISHIYVFRNILERGSRASAEWRGLHDTHKKAQNPWFTLVEARKLLENRLPKMTSHIISLPDQRAYVDFCQIVYNTMSFKNAAFVRLFF